MTLDGMPPYHWHRLLRRERVLVGGQPPSPLSIGTICARQIRSRACSPLSVIEQWTKGAMSAKTAKLMVIKLVTAAAKTSRRLKGENQLQKVVQGIKFQNGIEVIEMPAHHAA